MQLQEHLLIFALFVFSYRTDSIPVDDLAYIVFLIAACHDAVFEPFLRKGQRNVEFTRFYHEPSLAAQFFNGFECAGTQHRLPLSRILQYHLDKVGNRDRQKHAYKRSEYGDYSALLVQSAEHWLGGYDHK